MNKFYANLGWALPIAVGAAGIVAGIFFFIARNNPSPETCKNAGTLKREFLLNAVIVSSLLSCFVFFCSTKLSAQDKKENAAEQKTATANDVKKIIESQEWQELKVFWNLITTKEKSLEDEKNMGVIPSWKHPLFLHVIQHY